MDARHEHIFLPGRRHRFDDTAASIHHRSRAGKIARDVGIAKLVYRQAKHLVVAGTFDLESPLEVAVAVVAA